MHPAVLTFAICAVACVVAHGAILASIVSRRSTQPPPPAGVPRPRMLAEVVWALIPAIVLIFLLTATWIRVRDNARPKPGMMMKVAQ